ncbi:MAG: hypothetical protein LBC84_06420 [Prevotellaceae bacterium]|jgi:hypothetical protein|nr:hypothetical protein [Prevotellaceae bacterium]
MNVSSNTVLVNSYLGLLQRLNRETKINLVAGLISDIARKPEQITRKKDIVNRFFGAFQSDVSVDEMIMEIRSSRKFNRSIESL